MLAPSLKPLRGFLMAPEQLRSPLQHLSSDHDTSHRGSHVDSLNEMIPALPPPCIPSPSFYMDNTAGSSSFSLRTISLSRLFLATKSLLYLRCCLLCSQSQGPPPQPPPLQQLSLHQRAVPSEHLNGGNCIFNLKSSPRVVLRISKMNKAPDILPVMVSSSGAACLPDPAWGSSPKLGT